MIKFYHPVDMRSRRQMINFLQNHFRYYTLNSWNRSQSYACNLKIYNLGLDSDITDKLYEMIQAEDFYDEIRELLSGFGADHNYYWQAGMNGRNGGYLVLYQGEFKLSEYRSYCNICGQKNYRSVTETGNICGRCGNHSRVDYTTPPKQISIYSGRGTDDGEDFRDWSIADIKERVKLVQEFDKLADAIVQRSIAIAKNYCIEDEEFLVSHTRKVLMAV